MGSARGIDAEPVFDVGSVTKVVVTTALCMSLVDAGRLDLDAPVRERLAGFRGGGKDEVSARDLLEHRAGLWEWWPTYASGARTAEQALEVVQRLSLRYPPDAGRHYSDLGFMLLGAIVAREYGEPLEVVAAREIFQPLGMTSSGFRPTAADKPLPRVVPTSYGDWYERRMVATGSPYPVPVAADGFDGWREHLLVGEANDGNCWHAFGGVAGHAGLFTTGPDLLRFGTALLAALGGAGPWSRLVAAEFCRPGRDPGQGLGFRLGSGAAGPVVGHPGFPGAWFAVLPTVGQVVVLLTDRLRTRGEPASIESDWLVLLREAASLRDVEGACGSSG